MKRMMLTARVYTVKDGAYCTYDAPVADMLSLPFFADEALLIPGSFLYAFDWMGNSHCKLYCNEQGDIEQVFAASDLQAEIQNLKDVAPTVKPVDKKKRKHLYAPKAFWAVRWMNQMEGE